MLKIAIAASLLAAPAVLLAQPAEQMGNGMGTEADAAAHANSSPMPGTHGSSMHHSGMNRTMHHKTMRHTTRGASPSNDTQSTPNSSNSKSSTLNPMPH